MTTHHISPPSLCSYLPDQVSQLQFLALKDDEIVASKLYTYLSSRGFRRSGSAFYRPDCRQCLLCIASRVIVDEFRPSRRFRRVINRNAHMDIIVKPAIAANSEHYSLYQRYISARHVDGDMYPPSLHTFEQFLVHSPTDTLFVECREPNGKLIAVAVTDKVDNGLSSIYTFFDPDPSYNPRSLGVFCILKQIELAKKQELPYVYLGFWIPSVKKMSYKTDYTPIELLINQQWQRFDTSPDIDTIQNILNTQPLQVR